MFGVFCNVINTIQNDSYRLNLRNVTYSLTFLYDEFTMYKELYYFQFYSLHQENYRRNRHISCVIMENTIAFLFHPLGPFPSKMMRYPWILWFDLLPLQYTDLTHEIRRFLVYIFLGLTTQVCSSYPKCPKFVVRKQVLE